MATPLEAPLLEAEGLSKRYGGLIANNGVSLSLARGEIRGLIGPNGAGKTTFVNLLTGIEFADAGRIRLGDVELSGRPAHAIAAHGLVRTFQVARVFESLSVRENLLLPFLAAGSPGGLATGRARVRRAFGARHLASPRRRPRRDPIRRPAHAAAGVCGLYGARREPLRPR